MGVKRDFSTWIKGRIEEYNFAENIDFVRVVSAPQYGGSSSETDFLNLLLEIGERR
jgi:phage anti-repressor protein